MNMQPSVGQAVPSLGLEVFWAWRYGPEPNNCLAPRRIRPRGVRARHRWQSCRGSAFMGSQLFTVVSLLVTIVVQMITSVSNLRGLNLSWALAETFEAI